MLARPFNLSRWFAAVGLVSIASLSLASAVLLSRFLTEQMLRQEAVLTMEFIHSVVLAENATGFFRELLAAIRSSAELALETDDTGAREAAGDIIAEVARLGPGGTP